MYTHTTSTRGMGLLEVVVASALLALVFVGIFGVLQLGTKLATSNKEHAGAIALAQEHMEYVRSLSYNDVGVVGSNPLGVLLSSEVVTLNTISYTRITTVTFVDDPADGLGAADSNGVTNDYKAVKVYVQWIGVNGQRSVSIVSNVTPPAIEQ